MLRQQRIRLLCTLILTAAMGLGFTGLVLLTDPNPSQALLQKFKRPKKIPYPQSNPYTDNKYNLGKQLFFDPRLSHSNQMACASCHQPNRSWSDGLALGIGKGHRTLTRRVPNIINLAWGWSFFWDGRAHSLEEQALMPIQSEAEMDQKLPELVTKLTNIPGYQKLFNEAFEGKGITPDNIAKAIATFERSIVSDLSPFDYWVAGDTRAISEEAKQGFWVFNNSGQCVRCHSGWNFTNGSFADIGHGTIDKGRGSIESNPNLAYTFKTPSLRNVATRPYYMHDGAFDGLKEVIEHYNRGGVQDRPTSKLFLKPLNLSKREVAQLIAFLETLTSSDELVNAPELPSFDPHLFRQANIRSSTTTLNLFKTLSEEP